LYEASSWRVAAKLSAMDGHVSVETNSDTAVSSPALPTALFMPAIALPNVSAPLEQEYVVPRHSEFVVEMFQSVLPLASVSA
jgi:hypothetical protein